MIHVNETPATGDSPGATMAVGASRKCEPPNAFGELDFCCKLAGSIATVATNKWKLWNCDDPQLLSMS